ncbi:MAG: hypothetical protein NC177_04030 [Ruminococcus flavefaciens]|nr:hypothetical protein [Ruminococcus flavefaciens]
MKRFKVIITVILIIMLMSYVTGCMHDDSEVLENIVSASDIARIEIESTNYYPYYYSKYIVDFESNTVMITSGDSQGEEEKTRNFSEEKKENFVRKANMYGFFNWKESYEPMGEVDDGRCEYFLTIYNDGSQHETWCDNAYPITYDEMWDAFFEMIRE